jgi:proteic killer suppression protein
VIRSFRDQRTAALFDGRYVRSISGEVAERARVKLRMLNRANRVDDLMAPPGNRLKKLTGDRAGAWSIRVNDQWRVVFTWRDGDAWDVEFTDYH